MIQRANKIEMPPTAVEAECALLGSMILDDRTCDEIADILQSSEDFWRPGHAAIYDAIRHVRSAEPPVDMVKLTQHLSDGGMLQDVGGVDYLLMLAESVPSAASAGAYARMVREKADARRLIELHDTCARSLYSGSASPSQMIDSTVNRLIEMRRPEKSTEAHLSEYLKEALEDDRPRVATGLASLDSIVGGFEAGTFAVVGARPSMGKTAFAVSCCVNMVSSGMPVGFISAEMKGRRIGRRVVCAEARISTDQFEGEKHLPQMQELYRQISEWPLWIDETPGQHVDRACGRVRRWVREHGIKAVFIDYLQLLNADHETEYERCTYISKQLKSLSQELDIAVIVLAQLNRGNTQRTDKKPVMSDLRGSGTIEQDADYILLLHREGYYRKDEDALNPLESIRDDEAEIIVEKSRDGATGTAHTGWIGECGVFSSGAGA